MNTEPSKSPLPSIPDAAAIERRGTASPAPNPAAATRLTWLPLLVFLGVTLLAVSLLQLATLAARVLAIGLLAAGIVLALAPLRRALLTGPLFTLFRRAMPTLSATEQEALEAGTVGWDGQLFSGNPDWGRLQALQTPGLSAEEKAFLDGPVEILCGMLDDWRISQELQDLPPEVWDYLKAQGFFGMAIPRAYGGLEFSALAHSAVVTKVASRSSAAAVTVMVPNSLGPAKLLLHYGSEAQKQRYLPRLARGDEVPCFALTSPEAGSDAASMIDEGIVCREEGVLGIRVTWNKRFITLAPVATLLGLAFKLRDPDGLLGGPVERGITLALIPTDTPGVEIGRRHYPLNISFLNGPTRGRDVFMPLEWVIGGAGGVGRGWRMLMECLADGRAISLPASSTGAAKLACRATGAYARVRRQFKLPIGRFEGIEEPLARMAAATYVMDAARTITAAAIDAGERPSVISALVKYNLTEYGRRVVNDAMDVVGGSGICLGPRNWIGRIYHALPIGITVEGSNILTRSLITFGQGAIRAHPFLLREIQAVRNDDRKQGLRQFDGLILAHAALIAANTGRTLGLGLLHGRSRLPAGPVRRYYRQLGRMSAAFALTTDIVLMLFGGGLKRREKISGRLADILSQLYLAACTLKHFTNQGQQAADQPLVEWACQDALYRIQESFHAVFHNLPQRPVAWLLQRLIFPFGRAYRPPSDHLGHQVAALLLAPSPSRDRLTAEVFIPPANEAVGRLEDALRKEVAGEAAERKLRDRERRGEITPGPFALQIEQARAAGVIDENEAALLHAAHAARHDAVQVDDFSFPRASGKFAPKARGARRAGGEGSRPPLPRE